MSHPRPSLADDRKHSRSVRRDFDFSILEGLHICTSQDCPFVFSLFRRYQTLVCLLPWRAISGRVTSRLHNDAMCSLYYYIRHKWLLFRKVRDVLQDNNTVGFLSLQLRIIVKLVDFLSSLKEPFKVRFVFMKWSRPTCLWIHIYCIPFHNYCFYILCWWYTVFCPLFVCCRN